MGQPYDDRLRWQMQIRSRIPDGFVSITSAVFD